ncbi:MULTISPECIES: 1-phosphofructokinase family hexose kinase [Thermotoga]|jgi:1-phosphofructokinase|uniref:PfkB domain protein n=1 Tax=Thermotoga neapolitana (strain ATCC 49049 / DSM 4359 / NBRC 107923 / NS-E) TaxID=309803 RepID=B9KAE1_THENN|nr:MULTISPECIES: 1-phosphofructokinase family hexose kinase [Thermotoga]MDK2785366.1 1-phosphofructokinase [Thermotoga sp.]HBF10664.1 carbohydrate kinase [Thermotoga neapolitana]ACM23924.1 PfkB domain protein [Thermotoga neapolitana DSM 4359]AJG39953.1 carbohydrate kinase [Thermotoga sp. RQ7]KFZ21027.1 PfkB domain protein [Thermotoga neapolitana LA10]
MVLTVTLNPALDREIFIDDFQVNKLYRLRDLSRSQMTPGGKGINVSIALSKLGVPSVATGFVGGHIGRILVEELRKISNLITTNFVYVDGETRENIEIIDEKNQTITAINFPGPEIGEDDLNHFLRRYRMTLSKVDCVVISGSIPLGVSEDVCYELVRLAREKGIFVFVEQTPRLLERTLAGPEYPNVVKPDLRGNHLAPFGMELKTFEDYVRLAEKIAEKSQVAVVSYEVKNDIVATKDGVWIIKSKEEIDASHLLGAGDAYVAGMVYYFVTHGANFLEMAKFGFASALAATRRKEKYMPDLEAIKKEYDHFTVERVK